MKRGEAAAGAPSKGAKVWKVVKTVLFLTVVAAIGLAGGVAWTVFQAVGGVKTITTVIEAYKDPGKKAFGDRERLNFLCLGIDYNHDEKGMPFTKHARSDTIFVVSADRHGQFLNLVSIPRDMRVEIPGHGADKINTAYSYKADGDIELATRTVENFLNIKIDHVIVIKPYAAEHLVDALGGVDLDVEKDMDYDDNWGNLHIHLKKGPQHLNGRQAVGYIRFRKDAEGDRGRIRRQQQMVSALVSKAARFETVNRIGDIEAAIKKDVITDAGFNRDKLIDLAMVYRSFDRKKMKTGKVEGNDSLIDDTYFMVAEDGQKRQVVAQLIRGTDEPRRPADIRIEVLNGSRTAGAASRFADVLRQQGYQIVRVGNADTIKRTQLVDRINDPKATAPLQQLVAMRGTPEVRKDETKGTDADITIVLGENYRAPQ